MVGYWERFPYFSPIRGSGHVQGIYPKTCPDGDLGFAVQLNAETPLSSDRIVPRVTIGRITPSG